MRAFVSIFSTQLLPSYEKKPKTPHLFFNNFNFDECTNLVRNEFLFDFKRRVNLNYYKKVTN